MKIVYMTPRSGYATDLRSDTLWGYVCWAIRYLWGEKELGEFIARHAAGKPDFVLSSTFPFRKTGNQNTPFFPNPLDMNELPVPKDLGEYRLRKRLVKYNLLSLHDFQEVLNGRLDRAGLVARITNYLDLQSGKAESLQDEIRENSVAPVRLVSSTTHNTIDRLRGGTYVARSLDENGNLTEAGQLFHVTDTWWVSPKTGQNDIESDTGLYFLVRGDEEAINKYLAPSLRLLRHLGIGADRTAGKGCFDFEMENFSIEEPDSADSMGVVTLSLFRPSEKELDEIEASDTTFLSYKLERREGFVGGYSKLRKKEPVLYFREGSVFPRTSENQMPQYTGNIYMNKVSNSEELTHPVWSNGTAFMVNIKFKQ